MKVLRDSERTVGLMTKDVCDWYNDTSGLQAQLWKFFPNNPVYPEAALEWVMEQ